MPTCMPTPMGGLGLRYTQKETIADGVSACYLMMSV